MYYQFIYMNTEFNHPGLTVQYKDTSKPQLSSKSLPVETRKVLGEKNKLLLPFQTNKYERRVRALPSP